MKKHNIFIAAKQSSSGLVKYLYSQIQTLDWVNCNTCTIDEIESVQNASFFVNVLENMSFREIMNVCEVYRKKPANSIYVSVWSDKLIIGTTHFPGVTAGADSSFIFLKQQEVDRTPTIEELDELTTLTAGNELLQNAPGVLNAAATHLLTELKQIYLGHPGQRLTFIDKIAIYNLRNGEASPVMKYIYPLCETNGHHNGRSGFDEYRILFSKYLNSKSHIDKKLFHVYTRDEEVSETYKNVAIIGGGTAGYLSALALKKTYPNLPVTLIESSKIPVIGVGEATTPEIRRFLFNVLKFPLVDFYEKVKPTWKLGIKFFWGLPGSYYFNYPFGKSDIRSAYIISGDINYSSLTSVLMSHDSSFVVPGVDRQNAETYSSLSKDISYALHMDNASFISYLKEQALLAGVNYIDDLITGAEKNDSGPGISFVVGESGKKYEYDFYVDCSGFKSLLIEKVLGSPYVPYNNSLFTDTAVTGCIPNHEKVKPYTYAESMNNGWCWNIPMRHEDHRGYVFSSNYCTVDEAAEELKQKNPTIIDFKTVKFRSGRHQEICIGNVFAVGNSYAFVEPLESTGIHMIIQEIDTLTKNLPYLKKSASVRKSINNNLKAHWDYLKGFLSIHYKFNRKFNTEFWKDCREGVDISSIQWLVDMYHEVGMLSCVDEHLFSMITKEIKDDIFGLIGFDTLLLGQGVLPRNFDRSVRNETIWKSNVKTWKAIQELTVPLENDLKILTQHPELI
jgi:tryptophan halogenase